MEKEQLGGSGASFDCDGNSGHLGHLRFRVQQCAITAVFYYGIRTYWNILRIKGKSKRTRDMQHQFFMALVVQTAIPLFFMFLPNSVLTMAAIVDGNFGAWANVTVVMTHLYPGFDPFVTLFLIKSLRDTVCRESWVVKLLISRLLSDFFCCGMKPPKTVSIGPKEVTRQQKGRSMSSVVSIS